MMISTVIIIATVILALDIRLLRAFRGAWGHGGGVAWEIGCSDASGSPGVVALLCEARADKDNRNEVNDITPFVAAAEGHSEVVTLFSSARPGPTKTKRMNSMWLFSRSAHSARPI